MNSFGFTSYINKPTREISSTNTAVNHIFIKTPPIADQPWNIEHIVFRKDIADHFALFLSVSFLDSRHLGISFQKLCQPN